MIRFTDLKERPIKLTLLIVAVCLVAVVVASFLFGGAA